MASLGQRTFLHGDDPPSRGAAVLRVPQSLKMNVQPKKVTVTFNELRSFCKAVTSVFDRRGQCPERLEVGVPSGKLGEHIVFSWLEGKEKKRRKISMQL